MVDTCGYELPTSLKNCTQKDLTEVKIFQKVFFVGGGLWNTLYYQPVERVVQKHEWITRDAGCSRLVAVHVIILQLLTTYRWGVDLRVRSF